jgi:hypothetical protein
MSQVDRRSLSSAAITQGPTLVRPSRIGERWEILQSRTEVLWKESYVNPAVLQGLSRPGRGCVSIVLRYALRLSVRGHTRGHIGAER